MACNVPALIVPWSGVVDYCKEQCFLPLKFEVKEIPEDCVWEDIFVKSSRWAEVDQQVLFNAMMWVNNNLDDVRKIGVNGGNLIREKFSLTYMQERTDNILKKWLDYLDGKNNTETIQYEEL